MVWGARHVHNLVYLEIQFLTTVATLKSKIPKSRPNSLLTLKFSVKFPYIQLMDFRDILKQGVTAFIKILITFEMLKYSLKSKILADLRFEWRTPWNGGSET